MKVVVYLDHPLGERLQGDLSARGNNIANAGEWYLWLIMSTSWAVNASWLVDIMAMDSELMRPRALVDQMANLMRCDALVQTGGMISPHMRLKRNFADARRIPVIDLIHLGRFTPEMGTRPVAGHTWEEYLRSIATLPIKQLVT